MTPLSITVIYGEGSPAASTDRIESINLAGDPHPEALFWHSFWHTIWKYIYIWHIHSGILSDITSGMLAIYFIWHSIWHSAWHLFWHSFWHSVWHSLWQRAEVQQCPLRSSAHGCGLALPLPGRSMHSQWVVGGFVMNTESARASTK